MWTLKMRKDKSFYLTYDKTRRYFQYEVGNHSQNLPGQWELICNQGQKDTDHLVRVNQNAGYFLVNDDEGGIRALILEQEKYVE